MMRNKLFHNCDIDFFNKDNPVGGDVEVDDWKRVDASTKRAKKTVIHNDSDDDCGNSRNNWGFVRTVRVMPSLYGD